MDPAVPERVNCNLRDRLVVRTSGANAYDVIVFAFGYRLASGIRLKRPRVAVCRIRKKRIGSISFPRKMHMPKHGYIVFVLVFELAGCEATTLPHTISAVRPAAPLHSSRNAPQTIAMTHLSNFEDIGQDGHRTKVSWQSMSAYLTADEPSSPTESDLAAAAGERVGWYSDVAILHASDALFTSDETTFAHDCGGNRITSAYAGQTIYLTDPHSTHLLRLWIAQARNVVDESGYHADYVDADSVDDLRKFAARPCNNAGHTGFDEYEWTHATAQMYAAFEQRTGLAILANALYTPSPNGGHRISPGIALAFAVWGEMTEECYADTEGSGVNPGPAESAWTAQETAEIAIMATGKNWFCSGDYENGTDAAAAIPERMYQLASFLLTYQPAQASLKQPWLTGSNFRQNKETHLVALDPVAPQPTDISGLMTPSGVFAREYAACYLSGVLAGPCVAIVNPMKTAALARGYDNYTHTLAVTGSDPFDGGTIRVNGPAAPSLLPPVSGYILFP